jgi:myo-inositol catabolism protein IolC
VNDGKERTMIGGYDKPLYILPFDHRQSYVKGVFYWHEPLTAEQTSEVTASKQLIYEAFKGAVAGDRELRARAGILVDEQFGAAVLRDAGHEGYLTCVSTERSGQEEFDFEYGADFARHLESVNPTFAKVLVRYNPEAEAAMNARQAARLHRLSEYLARTGRLFMFELLVPATRTQLEHVGADQAAYDREMRPALMVRAIDALQRAGVEPDVWKVEGLDRREDCARMVAVAQQQGRAGVSCIVLGRGSDEKAVSRWLATAAGVRGFIGFAVGRTTWLEAVTKWRGHTISRAAAVHQITQRFLQWAAIFEHVSVH